MGSGTKHALDFNDAAEEARNKFKLVGRRAAGQRSLLTMPNAVHAHVHIHFNLLLHHKSYERIQQIPTSFKFHNYLFSIHVYVLIKPRIFMKTERCKNKIVMY